MNGIGISICQRVSGPGIRIRYAATSYRLFCDSVIITCHVYAYRDTCESHIVANVAHCSRDEFSSYLDGDLDLGLPSVDKS